MLCCNVEDDWWMKLILKTENSEYNGLNKMIDWAFFSSTDKKAKQVVAVSNFSFH